MRDDSLPEMDEFQRWAYQRKFDELVLFGRFSEEQAREMALSHAFKTLPTVELSEEEWNAWEPVDRWPLTGERYLGWPRCVIR